MSRPKKTANLESAERFARRHRFYIHADGRRMPILVRSSSGLSATAHVRARAERLRLILGPPLPTPDEPTRRKPVRRRILPPPR